MSIYTPSWVRDAVFYQIFPDRFAISARVPKPGPLEPWGAPPTHHGFKGGDLLGIVEHLPYLADLGINAIESMRGNREHLRGIGLTDHELNILGIKPAGE